LEVVEQFREQFRELQGNSQNYSEAAGYFGGCRAIQKLQSDSEATEQFEELLDNSQNNLTIRKTVGQFGSFSEAAFSKVRQF
jgi:hypothetical protein